MSPLPVQIGDRDELAGRPELVDQAAHADFGVVGVRGDDEVPHGLHSLTAAWCEVTIVSTSAWVSFQWYGSAIVFEAT